VRSLAFRAVAPAAMLILAMIAVAGTAAIDAAAEPAASGATSIPGALDGVAAVSATNAWAVGGNTAGALMLRWNGTSWDKVSGSDSAGASLSAVTATSATNAWAVGTGSSRRTLPLPGMHGWAAVPAAASMTRVIHRYQELQRRA